VLASVLVAWRLGLSAQGEFALLRSWTDALTAMLCLGVPQGLLQLTYREGVPVAALQGFALRFIAVTAILTTLVALLATTAAAQLPLAGEQVALVALALPLWVGHLLWRSLALRSRGVVTYAALTALPAALILLGVSGLVVADADRGFAWVLLAAALLSATAASWAVRAHVRQPVPWPQRTMWSVSLQTWVQGLAAAWMPAVLLSLAAVGGASLGEIGLLSLGLQVYQLFAVAAVYAAPQLYDYAARRPTMAPLQVLAGWRRHVGWPVLATAAALAVTGPWIAARLWPVLDSHEAALGALALAGLLSVVVRAWVTLLQAAGRVRELSWQALARLLLASLLTLWGMPQLGATLAVSLALLVTEVLTLMQMAAAERWLRQP
jgi:hypothetical protein